MHFLIVNDDGINSPFLPILTQAVKRAGHRVTVCVPATQQSAKAHAFSIEQPILAEKREVPDADEAWAIFGTPVDSCRIGAMNLAPDADAVISGINLGYNVGMSVYVSGTVGAAREATFLRKPGIAVSAEKQTPHDTLAYLSDWAVEMAEKLVTRGAPELTVCNLNAPPIPRAELKNQVLCPLNRAGYRDSYEQRISPRNQTYFWLSPMKQDPPLPGSDQAYLDAGHPTCTFLTIDGQSQEAFADWLK